MEQRFTFRGVEDPPQNFRYDICAGDEIVGRTWVFYPDYAPEKPYFYGVRPMNSLQCRVSPGELAEAVCAFLREQGAKGVYYEDREGGSCPYPGFQFAYDTSSGWDDHIAVYYRELSDGGSADPSA